MCYSLCLFAKKAERKLDLANGIIFCVPELFCARPWEGRTAIQMRYTREGRRDELRKVK